MTHKASNTRPSEEDELTELLEVFMQVEEAEAQSLCSILL